VADRTTADRRPVDRTSADRTPAERLDRAIDALLSGGLATAERELRPLLDTADQLRLALSPVPVSARFEADLARRVLARRRLNVFDIHVPTWLLLTGVSSAAVGVGVTAYAVWRGSHRSS
jgi:hypothetical protein